MPDPTPSPGEARKLEGRERARACARPFLERGDGTGWFEPFYRAAAGDAERVPWADREGHPLVAEWLEGVAGRGRAALVVGCGLGEDAELCARAGFRTTAFDLSPTAIAMCRELWPRSSVDYRAADLLNAPPGWRRAFELVVEVYTVQALPLALRARAIEAVAGLVAPGGTLLVVTMGRPEDAPLPDEVPWPLTPSELAGFEAHGLERRGFEERVEADPSGVPVPRWRLELERPE